MPMLSSSQNPHASGNSEATAKSEPPTFVSPTLKFHATIRGTTLATVFAAEVKAALGQSVDFPEE